MPAKSLWSRGFILLIAINALMALIYYLQATTLAMYASQTYQASPSLAGFAATIFILGSTIGRLFSGRYLDHIGRRRIVYLGFALYALASIAYLLAPNISALLLVRILHGVAFGIANTAISTVVLDFIAQDRRGEGIGYYSLSATGAAAIGPFLGVLLTQNFAYSILFGFCIACSLICMAIIPFVGILDHPRPAASTSFQLDNFIEPKAVSIATVMLLIGICYSCVTTFIGSFAEELDASSTVSIFFVVYAVVLFISRPMIGRLLDRRGDNIVMLPMIVILSLGLAVLGLAQNASLILLSAIPLALGFGNLMSCGQAIAVKSTSNDRAGLATASFYIFCDLGLGIGSMILGLAVAPYGYSGMFLLAAASTFVVVFVYWLLHGRYAALRQASRLS